MIKINSDIWIFNGNTIESVDWDNWPELVDQTIEVSEGVTFGDIAYLLMLHPLLMSALDPENLGQRLHRYCGDYACEFLTDRKHDCYIQSEPISFLTFCRDVAAKVLANGNAQDFDRRYGLVDRSTRRLLILREKVNGDRTPTEWLAPSGKQPEVRPEPLDPVEEFAKNFTSRSEQ